MMEEAFSQVIKQYGVENAKTVERLMRWETNHFKSKQWAICLTPGMEISTGNNLFPFGWKSLKEFCSTHNVNTHLFTTHAMPESDTHKLKTFIVFPDDDMCVIFIAFLLNKRKWNAGSWYSSRPESQRKYTDKLKGVKPRIVNSLVAL